MVSVLGIVTAKGTPTVHGVLEIRFHAVADDFGLGHGPLHCISPNGIQMQPVLDHSRIPDMVTFGASHAPQLPDQASPLGGSRAGPPQP